MTRVLGIVTIIVIIGLSGLVSQVHTFVAGPTDARDARSSKLGFSPVCDLYTLNGTVQTAFSINIRGSEKLSYTHAKAIDIVWQILVGAGGRFLMGWVAYKAFMDGLTRLMEQRPVPYDLYATLTFSTTSFLAVWEAIKTVSKLRGWKGKLFMIWFAVSTVYVLSFQTLISATGGYVQPSIKTLPMSDGSFVNFDSDGLTNCFVLTHPEIVGFPNLTVVDGPPLKSHDNLHYPPDPQAGDAWNYFGHDGFNSTYPDYRDLLVSQSLPVR